MALATLPEHEIHRATFRDDLLQGCFIFKITERLAINTVKHQPRGQHGELRRL